MFEECLAADVGALQSLAVEIALHHHLGGDPRVVSANHPQAVLALHPRMADEDVLQRNVEGVADVQTAGDVRRWHDDGEGRGIAPLRAEPPLPFPMAIPARLDG